MQIVYGAQQQRIEAESVIEKIINVLGALETVVGPLGSKFGADNARRIRQRVSTALLAEIIRLEVRFKSSAFQEEREWRAVQFVATNASTPQILFRSSQQGILPYLELFNNKVVRTSSETILPIGKVVFGPTLDNSVVAEGLALLFSKRGYSSVEVSKSSIPFRL